ncbi:TatD family hydrolase [Mycobacterium sp. NPDC051804]|uniref:TatD family hydrolase n=1 Tax=Mycobacterium sp. NPDC051804 TaxID=3364295 RepID=UPI00379EE0B5
MSSALPPLDLHAHIDTAIAPTELLSLRSVVFAATRSLAEAKTALKRQDSQTIWGVGCHPAISRSHDSFNAAEFRLLASDTAFVSEIGLDGAATVSLERQLRTLRSVFDALGEQPRVTSLHSHRATDELVTELSARALRGVVLHWWQGDEAATKRAIDIGCYFSINAAMFRRPRILGTIPRERLLAETDHPYGDRGAPRPRPGNVVPVEHALSRMLGIDPADVRRMLWRNFDRLVREVDCTRLLPRRVRSYLIASSASS